MRKIHLTLLFLCLGACSTVKESVGLVKNQPDEYQVVTNQSLEVPPDFNIYSPEELEARKKKTNINTHSFSKGENFILNNMGK